MLFEHGTPRWAFLHERVHELPLTGGGSSYRVSLGLKDDLVKISTSLLSALEWHGVAMVADACHALGARLGDRPVGSLAKLSTFSFHPVTGEGGAVTCDDGALAEKMRRFRNHGITTDHRQREARGSWTYEMVELGYNYRLSDFQCALGMSQLRKLNQTSPVWFRARWRRSP